jgi:low affinity Fe/Cu permease
MVFMIQATQNRDSLAIQLKLDELIRALKHARTGLVHLEDWPDEELEHLKAEFQKLSSKETVSTGALLSENAAPGEHRIDEEKINEQKIEGRMIKDKRGAA